MATTKLKGTSSKIKELKGIKPEKITDEQLKKVQDTVNDINILDGVINYPKENGQADS